MKRQEIIENVVTTLKAISDFGSTKVSTKFVTPEQLSSTKFPYAIVKGGTETDRRYEGARVVSFFSVIVYVWVDTKNDADPEKTVNTLLGKIETELEKDLFRGDTALNTTITEITTDEGWTAPYSMARVEVQCEYYEQKTMR